MEGSIAVETTVGGDRLRDMEAIVSEHETALLRYAARLVNSPVAAQDVVQNVFIKLFKVWNSYGSRPTERLKGWLYRVTHNEAVDYIRRESRLRDLHDRHATKVEVDTACPDGHNCPMPADEKLAVVMRHVNRLHPRERQVVLLRLEEGLSYKEISEITGRSMGNVGNILHHAVRKLSAGLKQEHLV